MDRIKRQSMFVSVALDALLTAQPDASLRQRTHEAYARELARRGLSREASDEA